MERSCAQYHLACIPSRLVPKRSGVPRTVCGRTTTLPRRSGVNAPFVPRCVLVTGGAGFIGVNFVRHVLEQDPDVRIVNLDLLTYAGNLESLDEVFRLNGPRGDGRHYFIRAEVRDFATLRSVLAGKGRETPHTDRQARPIPMPDSVVHMAAESHVDRSIMGPAAFVETNVQGTLT